jgi:hypothetical protein
VGAQIIGQRLQEGFLEGIALLAPKRIGQMKVDGALASRCVDFRERSAKRDVQAFNAQRLDHVLFGLAARSGKHHRQGPYDTRGRAEKVLIAVARKHAMKRERKRVHGSDGQLSR